MPTYRHVLFDLDNTLADRVAAVRHLAASLYESDLIDHSAISREDATDAFINFDKDGYQPDKLLFFRQVADAWGPMRRSPEQLDAWYRTSSRDWYLPEPAVVSLLQDITAAGIRWGIVTNGGPTQLDKTRLMKLDQGASCIVVSAIFGVEKPDPSIFRAALDDLGNPDPSATLFVGDNPTADIGGAQGVGMATAWIRREREWPADLTPPEHTLDSVVEVRNLLAL